MLKTIATGVVVGSSFLAAQAFSQIAVSSNDHKLVQENGVTRTVDNPPPDTITVLDLGASPVKVLYTLSDVPGSVAGPPLSVAITSDESLALVASSTQIDPADRTKTVPDNRVSVIDLKEHKVIDTIQTGAGAAGTSITKDGKRAYVANRMAGSISILSIDGKKVSLVKTFDIAPAAALVSHIAVSSDGATGVATRNGDAKVAVLKLGGDAIAEKAVLDVAPRPYAAAVAPDGRRAVVASLGDPKGNGMLTILDISGDTPKVIDTVDIGHESLEGMMMSGDGKWVAGVAHAGTTRPKDAPQYKANGVVVLYKFEGDKLTKTSEAPIGGWSQGAAFSRDGSNLLVQNMIQKNIQVFRNDNGNLTDTGQKIETGGGAAAIRSSSDR